MAAQKQIYKTNALIRGKKTRNENVSATLQIQEKALLPYLGKEVVVRLTLVNKPKKRASKKQVKKKVDKKVAKKKPARRKTTGKKVRR